MEAGLTARKRQVTLIDQLYEEIRNVSRDMFGISPRTGLHARLAKKKEELLSRLHEEQEILKKMP
jgi:hypothetical protein